VMSTASRIARHVSSAVAILMRFGWPVFWERNSKIVDADHFLSSLE